MAAREDAGSGRGVADPSAGATNPRGSSGTPAAAAPAQTVLTAVVGSPAFPHPNHHQYYAASPFGQQPAAPVHYPTPSPYQTNFSATPASTRWSSKSAVSRYHNHVLRFLAIAFCFVTVALIGASATARDKTRAGTKPDGSSSLLGYPPFRYLFSVGIIVGLYSLAQLFKGIWEISFKCNLFFSPKTVDYGTFILDTVFSYLLLSSASVAVLGLQLKDKSPVHDKVGASAWSLAGGSIGTSFAAFAFVATSALYSGYKLCKRIIW